MWYVFTQTVSQHRRDRLRSAARKNWRTRSSHIRAPTRFRTCWYSMENISREPCINAVNAFHYISFKQRNCLRLRLCDSLRFLKVRALRVAGHASQCRGITCNVIVLLKLGTRTTGPGQQEFRSSGNNLHWAIILIFGKWGKIQNSFLGVLRDIYDHYFGTTLVIKWLLVGLLHKILRFVILKKIIWEPMKARKCDIIVRGYKDLYKPKQVKCYQKGWWC